jgi:hypothetical protein
MSELGHYSNKSHKLYLKLVTFPNHIILITSIIPPSFSFLKQLYALLYFKICHFIIFHGFTGNEECM